MGLADQFRKHAAECLLLAETATSLESRAQWLFMARLWMRMAAHADEREMTERVPSIPPEKDDKSTSDSEPS